MAVDVPRDHVRTLDIGGTKWELEASLGAGIAYSREFRGKLDKPYDGNLADDMFAVWGMAQETVKAVDEDGNPLLDEDGKPMVDDKGKPLMIPNPDQFVDVEACLRLAWAMAWAAGSTTERWPEWEQRVLHTATNIWDEAEIYATVVLTLGGGVIFRRRGEQEGATEPDEGEEKRG